MAVVKHAKAIVVEVNPSMPRTHGDTNSMSTIARRSVLVNTPLTEYVHEPADAVAARIARYVAEIIEDGATLHVDLGRIPNETLKYLHHRRDLGIHSNVITEAVVDLIEQGVITGRGRRCIPERSSRASAWAAPSLRFRRRQSVIRVHADRICRRSGMVARNERMASLTQAFAIDLPAKSAPISSMANSIAASRRRSIFTVARRARGQADCLPAIDDGRRLRIAHSADLACWRRRDPRPIRRPLCRDRIRHRLSLRQVGARARHRVHRHRASGLSR